MSSGTVYVSDKELTELISLRNSLPSGGTGIEMWGVPREERRQIGTDQNHFPRNAPDWLLVKLAKDFIQPGGYAPFLKVCECDAEEDIEGKTGDGSGKARLYPDLAPNGPASVAGKVILELARRLEEEVAGDQRMEIMAAESNIRLIDLWRQWGWIKPEETEDE